MLTEGMLPRAPRAAVYRRRGYRIGRDVEFAPGVVIEGDDVEIGDGASFGLGAVIRGRRVRIGRRVDVGAMFIFEGRDVEIGDDTVIREQVFVGGPLLPDSLLAVGKRVRIFQMCFLNPSRPLRIGDVANTGSLKRMEDDLPGLIGGRELERRLDLAHRQNVADQLIE